MNEKSSATAKHFPDFGSDVEEELFGKWFPRLGALAVVLGSGFGFKYAIDQGWVSPTLRIMLGVLLSSVLMSVGDVTRKREWAAYAQAITGGGVALLYLTLWAAVGMYALLPPTVGFICLMGVSALGCAVALRHESQALALLAIVGGFVNPFVTGAADQMPQGLYLYIFSIDLAVVLLTFVRPWHALEKVAFTASWIVLEIGGGSRSTTLIAATGIFLMFGALPYARVFLNKGLGVTDLALVPINGFLYYFAVFTRSTGSLEQIRGPLALGLAIFFFAGYLLVRGREEGDESVGTSSAVMSLIFLTLWSPVQLGTELMALGWSVEALVLFALALTQRDPHARVAGWIVVVMATATQLVYIAEAPETALIQNYGRSVLFFLVSAIYLGSYVEHRDGASDARNLGVVAANMLTIFWLSLEVYVAASMGVASPDPQDLQFGLSGVWALYASLLLVVGIFFRVRQARLMSLALFGATVTKMALHDLWLLDTLQRLIGFVGIGLLLLACSAMYQRFREWVLEEA